MKLLSKLGIKVLSLNYEYARSLQEKSSFSWEFLSCLYKQCTLFKTLKFLLNDCSSQIQSISNESIDRYVFRCLSYFLLKRMECLKRAKQCRQNEIFKYNYDYWKGARHKINNDR